METVFALLALPFVYFVLWGPVAFFYATRLLVRRLRRQYPPRGTTWRAFGLLASIFLPVAVSAPDENIPIICPWWSAVLATRLALETGVRFEPVSVVLAVLAMPLAMWVIEREVQREHPD